MELPSPDILRRIHVKLEDQLMGLGFDRGAHVIHLGSRLNRQIRQQDSDWDNPSVFTDNLADLVAWADKTLTKMGVAKRPQNNVLDVPPLGSTPAALAYLIASDQQIQQQVTKIRTMFWSGTEPPFSGRSLGLRTALLQAGDWLTETAAADSKTGRENFFVGLDFVLAKPNDGSSIYSSIQETLHHFNIPQEDGTLIGSRMSLKDFNDRLSEDLPLEEIEVRQRTLKLCDSSGNNRPFVTLRGIDGWIKHWPIRHEGKLLDLFNECSALSELAGKWSEHEALEYIMIGTVPLLGVQHNWRGSSPATATLTLTFRGPVTKEDVIEAYEKALRQSIGCKVKARRLSMRQQAVLQLVHDLPNATWKQRLQRYDEWCQHHPQLPRYRGAAAQQAIRKDYERASSRATWQYVGVELDE